MQLQELMSIFKRQTIDERSRRFRGLSTEEAEWAAAQEEEKAVAHQLHNIFEERNQRKSCADPSFQRIPCFFHKTDGSAVENLAAANGGGTFNLGSEMQKLYQKRFLEKKERDILEPDELCQVEQILRSEEFCSPPFFGPENENQMNYDHYCRFREELERVCPKAKPYFSSKVFMALKRDAHGRINQMKLFEQLLNTIEKQKLKITLCYYDSVGKGSLREQELEIYIYDMIPSAPLLAKMHENFIPYYVFTAVRRFMFVLDPKKTGKIPIDVLVSSKVMCEFQDLLKRPDNVSPSELRALNKNWFSLQNAMSVYSMYLGLDEDENGMLSKRELMRYEGRGNGTPIKLTFAFVNRVFEEIITYRMNEDSGESEVDYKTFLDFALAMEMKNTAQSLQYFWKLLDLQKTGYLNTFSLNYFFRDIVKELERTGIEPPNAADVNDEIFDMVKPKIPFLISFEDLSKCGVGHTIISMLIDVNGFWAYDNRESMGHEEEDNDEEEQNNGSMRNVSGASANINNAGNESPSTYIHAESGNLLDDDADDDF